MSMNSLFRRNQQPNPDNLDADTDEDDQIDPNLRLRTVRTAASTIAESIRSEQRMERRRIKRRRLWGSLKSKKSTTSALTAGEQRRDSSSGPTPSNKPRRNVYVNCNLAPQDKDSHGRPLHTFVRNKVKTTKYTIITFIPKNLYEQFRRVANLYFLGLVCIQVFPIFGAAAPQIAMLPLLFILTVTALKDGVEDYRRGVVDEEVNNSAATKLGDWRNVNVPDDSRPFWQKLLGLNRPGTISRGVRRLREKELEEGAGKIVLTKNVADDASEKTGPKEDAHTFVQRARSLEDIQSVHSGEMHEYPPIPTDVLGSRANLTIDQALISPDDPRAGRLNQSAAELSYYPSSTRTGASGGVLDWSRQTPGTAKWERTLWKKLEIGDVVLLRDNDQIPADIVVLSTSDADGLCYVETKNLDGETNLKPRKSLKATSMISSEEDVEHASFIVDSEPPHPNLYLYNAVLRYQGRPDSDEVSGEATQGTGVPKEAQTEPVTINNLLLRGCTVRNTGWIIGLVVFTGADTKIMLNGGDTPSKRSKIEKETNFNVIMNFLILLSMCVSTAIVSGYFETLTNTSSDFYETNSQPSKYVVLNSLITFCSCLIAFQNIVPISLYISIEIVKTIQAYFISQDVDMWYQPYDTACVPKTWNISDDLGQIEYIFSDKTGTLTQNIMEFQKCSVNGVTYGEGITEAMRGAAKREGRDDYPDPQEQAEQLKEMKATMLEKMAKTFKNRYLQAERVTLVAPNLAEHLADKTNPQRQHLIQFFRALAVCHTVLSDRPEPRDQPYRLDYKAESPDEAALVAAARDAGFPFVAKSNTSIDIEVMGQPERYIPLRVLEFNSTRKRMSVIVRNPEGKIVLYCKGADSVIYARLASDHDPALKEATARDMEAFANAGLRTLCISYRYLSEEEYLNWSRQHDVASSATENREEEIDKVNEKVEHSLNILGATALEDKLQEGVPDAIETLHQAGIKLWILTGDKVQTAIEIGFSCNLLKSDMEIMILAADSLDDARNKVEAALNKLATILGPPQKSNKSGIASRKKGCAVVIDGDTLRHALDPSIKPLFLSLGTQCDTVVCCRVSPAQKALTVKLVKDGCNAMTLSIGDGANDVAMIQEANIGCGLLGLEGSQAAMSADYAFGQFRFLTKLLLVHGRWSYIRVADMHSNFFYKNVIWTCAMFWFLFFNSFDATYLYEYTFILGYNLFFTSLPVIVLGAFDQDINAKASLAYPQLYVRGIKGLEYTRTKFWMYMFDGFYQSVIVFFIPYLSFSRGASVSWSGKTLDSLADFGTTVAIAAIFSANLFVGLNTRYWTVITWVAVVGSMLLMCIWVVVYSYFHSISFNKEAEVLFSTVGFWATVIFAIILALGPRFVLKFINEAYFPADRDIIREAWVLGDLKDRLGIQRRRASKGTTASKTEDASLFQPHQRDASDNSSDQDRDGYEPVSSPTRFSHIREQAMDNQTKMSPRRQPTAMSYYSASDIPISEQSKPQEQRRPTLNLHPSSAVQHRPDRVRASPPSPLQLSPKSPISPHSRKSPTRLSPTGPSTAPGEYEMTLRSHLQTPEPSGHSRASQASQASFVTAEEGGWESAHEDDRATVRQQEARSSYYAQQGYAI